MQLMPILLLAAILAVDGGLTPLASGWGLPAWTPWVIACLPVVAIIMIAWIIVSICERRLKRGRIDGTLEIVDGTMRAGRVLILLNHVAAVLVFGWLGAVRSAVGNQVLVDELIALLPPLVGLAGLYWAYYPIERRLRDATLIRQLDEGRPIYPTLTRSRYVALQVRLQLLLMLVPILLIVGLAETIDVVAPRMIAGFSHSWMHEAARLCAVGTVFLFAPLIGRVLLDVQPLPAGAIRQDLLDVCERHRVRARELLLWNTNGSMINAAVMGLIAPLRYVLLTDMLLETLRREQVQAVMAHEIGHVRRRHMPWMIVCLLASFVLAAIVLQFPVQVLDRYGTGFDSPSIQNGIEAAIVLLQLALALVIFGWISRRFERQADTFAVQHLSRVSAELPGENVTPTAVDAMQSALGMIAALNSINPERRSWRHGSIAWRQRYLGSLIGQPVRSLRIDRTVAVIKWIAAGIVIGTLAWQGWVSWNEPEHGHAHASSAGSRGVASA